MLYHCARSSSCSNFSLIARIWVSTWPCSSTRPSSRSTARARGAPIEISASASHARRSAPRRGANRSRAHRLHRATPQRPSANSGALYPLLGAGSPPRPWSDGPRLPTICPRSRTCSLLRGGGLLRRRPSSCAAPSCARAWRQLAARRQVRRQQPSSRARASSARPARRASRRRRRWRRRRPPPRPRACAAGTRSRGGRCP